MKKNKANYIVIGVIFALSLLGAFWALYYQPGTRDLTDLRAKLESHKRNLITTRELAAQIPRLEDELERVSARIEAVTDKLPPATLTHGEAMAGLKSLADELGLGFQQVQPLPEEEGASSTLSFMQFDVSVDGPPRGVYDYLSSIEHAPTYLMVPGASFSAAYSKGVRAQVRVLVPVAPSKEVNHGPQATRQ